MLSDEERREIEAELTRYPTQQARLHRRDEDRPAASRLGLGREPCTTSPRCLEMTAGRARQRRDLLQHDLPPSRRPARDPRLQQRHLLDAGRRSAACSTSAIASWASGSGETSADGRFTLLPIVCLGACDHAPA